MILVKELTKRYDHNTAVDQISFEVTKGQIVGFLGPNGAGKTTTMRILTCFLPPSAGTASVAGFDVLALVATAQSTNVDQFTHRKSIYTRGIPFLSR